MASPIIAAIRQRRDLKESLLHTAQELAHLASIYGVVKVSYAYLALKCRCSRRTVLRHIQRLVDAKIIRKTVLWIRGNYCEINTYTFRLAWKTSRPTGGSDKTAQNLPPQEREKNASLREELDNAKKILRDCTPGSIFWQWSQDNIERLEELLAASPPPATTADRVWRTSSPGAPRPPVPCPRDCQDAGWTAACGGRARNGKGWVMRILRSASSLAIWVGLARRPLAPRAFRVIAASWG